MHLKRQDNDLIVIEGAGAGASNNEKHHHSSGPRGGLYHRVFVVFAGGESSP
jgi:hypothetical protein